MPPPDLDTTLREQDLDALEAGSFDLLVIGGGITGAGIAREASLRGLSVALLEADDFASGTSSRSSKLVHGGLRYLAQGEVALVRETALERKRVYGLAPHLAEKAWMLVPARSRAGLLKFRAGIATYEKLGGVAAEDRHESWGPDELREREPALDVDRTPFACVYREYVTDDARLVLANLRAARAHGARVVNRVGVDGILRESGRVVGATATATPGDRRLRIRAACVVNAAGPWVEAVRALDEPEAAPVLHLSKGIHVTLPAERLPVRQIVIVGTEDKRSIFVVPRGDTVYVGTTDTSCGRGADRWPVATREDVEYLLRPLEKLFTVRGLSPSDCIGAWAGLRPLVAEPGKRAREMSRRDEIWIGRSGLVSIAGGKLTGYRKMAEEALDAVGRVLGREPAAAADDTPLPGGDFDGDLGAAAASLTARGVAPRAAERLVRLYGSEAPLVVERGGEPLAPGAAVLAGEVDWAARVEAAATLEDFVYRRTRAALYRPTDARAVLEPAAVRLGALLGWDTAEIRDQVERVRARLAADIDFAAAEVREEA
ncbi:MAG: glycerol-3-phosphate dehydrogenase/oxidase [Proteobacteria bacterium]|nr:glycerol-3-phosphate dehydrogenase/oxidase [Pseudomonadota bacterium]